MHSLFAHRRTAAHAAGVTITPRMFILQLGVARSRPALRLFNVLPPKSRRGLRKVDVLQRSPPPSLPNILECSLLLAVEATKVGQSVYGAVAAAEQSLREALGAIGGRSLVRTDITNKRCGDQRGRPLAGNGRRRGQDSASVGSARKRSSSQSCNATRSRGPGLWGGD